MEAEEVINLHFSRGKIFVWNSRDVRLLRETHHIVGSLTGALPRAPRQNIQLGLPLELMPEEAFALISYGVGVLVRLSLPKVTEDDVSTFQEARRSSFEIQKELYTEQIRAKKEAMKGSEHQLMSKRKKRKMEKKRERKRKRDEEGAINSCEKSVAVDHHENEGRSIEECTADTKDMEKISTASSGIVVEENTSVEMVRVTSSVSSGSDRIQSGSTYTTSDSKQEFSSTQVLGDQAICSSTFQEKQCNFQEHDILHKQSQKTDDSITVVKESEALLQSIGNVSHIKEENDGACGNVGATSKGECEATVEEDCQLQHKNISQNFLKMEGKMMPSGKKESATEIVSSEMTKGHHDTNEKGEGRKEQMVGSYPMLQGILSNRTSRDRPSGMNIGGIKAISPIKDDACPLSAIQIERKSQRGMEEQKGFGQVSDRTSGVGRSHPSSPLEGTTRSENDRYEHKKPKANQDSSCLVQLFTEARDTNFTEVTDWPFPSTDQEKLRAAVFMHFWEQGYYLTSGMKFGGDFLVYKGSPLLFHSTYIAICIPYERSMSTQTLISYGRLGPIVKKTVVLCSLNENDEVRCVSLQWSGI